MSKVANPVELVEITPEAEVETALTALLRLSPAPDFSRQLESLRDSGARDLLDEVSEAGQPAWIQRPVRIDQQAFLFKISEAGQDGESSLIRLRLQADDAATHPPTEAQVREALNLAVRRFWWNLDMEEAKAALNVNDYGRELVNHYWPHRPGNLSGPWEGLLKTVVSVQIYPGLATRLQQGLIDFYSDPPVNFSGRAYRFYPSVERLAEVIPEDLLGLRFSRQKARYLPAIAQQILEQPERYDWERLRNLPGPEAVAILDELPGVGPWTAHYVAMRGLPHPDVFIDEAGLRKLLTASFNRRSELTSQEAAELTSIYSPHRSLACYYSYMKMYSV